MGKMSLREAVKHFDVSRPTLQKALKSGKISGSQDGNGHWTIDPAELARIYRPRTEDTLSLPDSDAGNLSKVNRDLKANLDEVEKLRVQLADAEKRAAVAEALAEERAQRIEDLRRLLPAPGQPMKKPSWWPF